MIEQKVLRAIDKYRMLDSGDKVLVGFSGGVDSTALLYILDSLKKELKLELYAAHLNHSIRGKASDNDAEYVKKTCRKLGIPLLIEKFDVPGSAKQKKLNLEDAARKARYDLFDKAAARFKADKIALAHNSDDNIETFLMRLIRGSGLRGLLGIPPVRDNIIRPLIEVPRKEIESYLKLIKIEPRIDRTNLDLKYVRNRVRKSLIPALESYNRNFKQAILRTIRMWTTDYGYIRSVSEAAFKELARSGKNEVSIDAKKLSGLDPAVRAEVLRIAIEKVKKDLVGISFGHIEEVSSLLGNKRARIDLPGLSIYICRGKVSVSSINSKGHDIPSFSRRLDIPGKVRVPEAGYSITSSLIDADEVKDLKTKDPYQAYIDHDKIDGSFMVRNRRKGDAFYPLGLKGKKKLQDIFVDQKIDLEERDRIPLIENRDGIVWVVGYRISEGVKVTPRTRKIVRITATPLQSEEKWNTQ